MINPNILKSVNKDVVTYPNVKSCEISFLGSDNKVCEGTVVKEEAELALYLKSLNLKGVEMDKLVKLISDYGDSQYEKGSFDESYEG